MYVYVVSQGRGRRPVLAVTEGEMRNANRGCKVVEVEIPYAVAQSLISVKIVEALVERGLPPGAVEELSSPVAEDLEKFLDSWVDENIEWIIDDQITKWEESRWTG